MTDAQIREWYGLAIRISRGYFLEGAERADVEQEALVGLVKGLRDYRPELGVPIKPFLGMTVHRQLVSAVKRHQRAKHRSLTFAARVGYTDEGREATVTELAADPRGSVEDAVVRREEMRAMVAALGELTDCERETLDGFIAGETYEGMAARLGRSAKSIDNAIQRTRRKVADRMAA